MSKTVIANWKALPNTLAEAYEILDSIDSFLKDRPNPSNLALVLCPPFVYLEEVSKTLKTLSSGNQIELGVQDIAVSDEAGQTGEITGKQLVGLGVHYVIIGHSERRWKLGESDEMVNKKLKLALAYGFTPIVCIGEKIRDENFKGFLKEQINSTFAGLSEEQIEKCLIAYEPVWAISVNPGAKPDTPEATLESVNFIKGIVNTKILYGGSVDSKNVIDFMSLPEIAGVLVGGASVNKEEFVKILNISLNV